MRIPLAEALLICSLPKPFSLAAAAARSRGGLEGADVEWRVADQKPSRESLPGCRNEVLFLGVLASTNNTALARVRAHPRFWATGPRRIPSATTPTPALACPGGQKRPVNWPRFN